MSATREGREPEREERRTEMRESGGEGLEEPALRSPHATRLPHTPTPHEIEKVKKEGEREVGREEERIR
jgi:hypothetical protein